MSERAPDTDNKKVPPKDAGFSLVEIMAAMFIVALIAGGVLFAVVPVLTDAKIKTARNDINTLKTGIETYMLINNDYPSSLDELEESGIVDVRPDPWDREYVYEYPGSNGTFDIVSYGRDGAPGGEGEDADITSWDDE